MTQEGIRSQPDNKLMEFIYLNLTPLKTSLLDSAQQWIVSLGKALNESAKDSLINLKTELEVQCKYIYMYMNVLYMYLHIHVYICTVFTCIYCIHIHVYMYIYIYTCTCRVYQVTSNVFLRPSQS